MIPSSFPFTMPVYQYKAITPEGKETTSSLEALDRPNALKLIRGLGLVPVLVSDTTISEGPKRPTAAPRRKRKIKMRELVMFTHQNPAVWADLGMILWAAGLKATAAWTISTETAATTA